MRADHIWRTGPLTHSTGGLREAGSEDSAAVKAAGLTRVCCGVLLKVRAAVLNHFCITVTTHIHAMISVVTFFNKKYFKL